MKLAILIFLWSSFCFANQKSSLGEELSALELPVGEVGAFVVKEKLYSVQDRHMPLERRFELSLGGGHKVSDAGHIARRDVSLGGRYYLNSKWSVGGDFSYAFNSLSSAAMELYQKERILPKLPFVTSSVEVTARYLLFYGKFRLSMDRVFYFDHFVSLGPALINLDNGSSPGLVADTGLVFWFRQNWNAVLGVKNYTFSRPGFGGADEVANELQLRLALGFLFGGSRS